WATSRSDRDDPGRCPDGAPARSAPADLSRERVVSRVSHHSISWSHPDDRRLNRAALIVRVGWRHLPRFVPPIAMDSKKFKKDAVTTTEPAPQAQTASQDGKRGALKSFHEGEVWCNVYGFA